jgi:hypothetical protein
VRPIWLFLMLRIGFIWIRMGLLPSKFRARYIEHSSDRHSPSLIRLGSSPFQGECGISHNL